MNDSGAYDLKQETGLKISDIVTDVDELSALAGMLSLGAWDDGQDASFQNKEFGVYKIPPPEDPHKALEAFEKSEKAFDEWEKEFDSIPIVPLRARDEHLPESLIKKEVPATEDGKKCEKGPSDADNAEVEAFILSMLKDIRLSSIASTDDDINSTTFERRPMAGMVLASPQISPHPDSPSQPECSHNCPNHSLPMEEDGSGHDERSSPVDQGNGGILDDLEKLRQLATESQEEKIDSMEAT